MSVSCPICGKSDVNFVTDRLRRGEGKAYGCTNCAHEFLVLKTERNDSDFYTNNYWNTVGPNLKEKICYRQIFDSYVGYQKNRISTLKNYVNADLSLVEVGCSTGHFLFNIKDFFKEVVGIDYDPQALNFCAQVNNCRTYAGGVDGALQNLRGEKFDIVCCFQVLEHVSDLTSFLHRLKSLCKSGGLIYIEVPNLYDPLKALYNVPGYIPFYYHEDHLHYFSKKSLGVLLDQLGFQGDFVFYQDYNFINHMSWILTNQPQVSCHQGLGNIDIPFNSIQADVQHEFSLFFNKFSNEYTNLLVKSELTDNMAVLIRG